MSATETEVAWYVAGSLNRRDLRLHMYEECIPLVLRQRMRRLGIAEAAELLGHGSLANGGLCNRCVARHRKEQRG